MDEPAREERRKIVAACLLAAAMVAALVFFATRSPQETSEPVETAAVASGSPPAAAPDPPATEPDEAAAAAPTPAVPDPAPANVPGQPELATATPMPAPEAPRFDVVRISPDGSAVVAGRAAPGAAVTIFADEAPLAEAQADADGNFVAIFEARPSGEPQELTLQAETESGESTVSDEVVMLLPEARPAATSTGTEPGGGQATAEAEPGPGAGEPEIAAATVGSAEQAEATAGALTEDEATEPAVAGSEAVVATAGSAAAEDPEPIVAATAILRPDAVEATPTTTDTREVTLASISYAEQGEITLAGLGAAGAVLRIYVDDAFAREAAVGPDGRWSMELGEMAEGVYRLRIDQLGSDGRVASRVETPFKRDYPQAPVPRPGGGTAGKVTVQPGNNLWTLARLHYGSGVLYTQIFTANQTLIQNPDLIYPGQIFVMPEMTVQ